MFLFFCVFDTKNTDYVHFSGHSTRFPSSMQAFNASQSAFSASLSAFSASLSSSSYVYAYFSFAVTLLRAAIQTAISVRSESSRGRWCSKKPMIRCPVCSTDSDMSGGNGLKQSRKILNGHGLYSVRRLGFFSGIVRCMLLDVAILQCVNIFILDRTSK